MSRQKRKDTLPETNSSPLKMMVSNRNLLFQGSILRGELLVSGSVTITPFKKLDGIWFISIEFPLPQPTIFVVSFFGFDLCKL